MNNTVYATYLIPESRFENMEKAVKKLARKVEAGKTAAEFPPAIEETRETLMIWERGVRSFYNPQKEYSPKAEIVPYLWVTIKYARPVLNGWKLLAVYDWEITVDGTRTCYVSKVPGEFLTNEQHDCEDGRCDHCNTNRRRNKAMLITKDYMDFMVVGSTCIKDFLGHATPKSFIDCYSFEQTIESLSDGSYAGGPSIALYPVKRVLELAAYFIRTEGYVKASEPLSTVSAIGEQFHPAPDSGIVTPTEDDELTAKYAVKWLDEQSDFSDYITNVKKAVNAGAISPKRMGLVASIVYAYQRHLERVTADNAPKCNEHIGKVKERLKGLTATVQRVRHVPGYYGMTSIITLRTPQGHCLVWFASGHHEPGIGEIWTLDGTVKEHNEYNGEKQTVITRVKH